MDTQLFEEKKEDAVFYKALPRRLSFVLFLLRSQSIWGFLTPSLLDEYIVVQW